MLNRIKHLVSKIGTSVLPNKWMLLFSSSLLFHLALFWPPLFSLGSFLFLIPLFYLAIVPEYRVTFTDGFLWGILGNVIHLYAFIPLFIEGTNQQLGLLIPIALMVYGSLVAGIWFFFAQMVARFVFTSALEGRVISWLVFTYLYFVWMNGYAFSWFGKVMGNPFYWPLLPLAHNASWLAVLSFFGSYMTLAILIAGAMCVALFCLFHKLRYLGVACLFFFPFLTGVMIGRKQMGFPACIHKIGHIRPPDYDVFTHPLDVAQQIYYKMVALIDKKPDIQVIVMPESSYRFSLNDRARILDLWAINVLGDDIALLVGSLRSSDDKMYNAAFWLKDGKIKSIYDKVHLVPFTECIPNLWKRIPYLNTLFESHYMRYEKGDPNETLFDFGDTLQVEPCICSDFFLGTVSAQKGCPVALLVNETVFSCRYMQELLFLYAKYKALELQRDILYVGYAKAVWINRAGETIQID